MSKQAPARYTSTIRFCAKSHEYGFIHHETADGACQLFFHCSEFRVGQYLRTGLQVNYQLGFDRQGRVCASRCYVLEPLSAIQIAEIERQVSVLVHEKPSKPAV